MSAVLGPKMNQKWPNVKENEGKGTVPGMEIEPTLAMQFPICCGIALIFKQRDYF